MSDTKLTWARKEMWWRKEGVLCIFFPPHPHSLHPKITTSFSPSPSPSSTPPPLATGLTHSPVGIISLTSSVNPISRGQHPTKRVSYVIWWRRSGQRHQLCTNNFTSLLRWVNVWRRVTFKRCLFFSHPSSGSSYGKCQVLELRHCVG